MDNPEVAASLASIADSLKRIADALEGQPDLMQQVAQTAAYIRRGQHSDRMHGR